MFVFHGNMEVIKCVLKLVETLKPTGNIQITINIMRHTTNEPILTTGIKISLPMCMIQKPPFLMVAVNLDVITEICDNQTLS